MKKLYFLFSLYLPILLVGEELSSEILSEDINRLFKYRKEQNNEQSSQLEKSWVNPVMLQYSQNYSTQYPDRVGIKQFVISVDQPIFKMGGIRMAIKYASALERANEIDIEIQKRELITKAYKILYNLRKAELQLMRMELLIENDNLDIEIQRESYEAGLTNRTLYDQALLKRNRDITSKLEIEMNIENLKNDFSLLSDRPPESFKLPNFTLMEELDYMENQLELKRDRVKIEEKKYKYRMIWSKYLPQISLTGRYVDEDLNPMFATGNLKNEYYTYGFKISIPISINSKSDIENNKIAFLESKIDFDEREKKVRNNYRLTLKRIEIINKKIALSDEDAYYYQSMLKTTQELKEVGDKTDLDIEIISNTLKIRELDTMIYTIDGQLELLELYKLMN